MKIQIQHGLSLWIAMTILSAPMIGANRERAVNMGMIIITVKAIIEMIVGVTQRTVNG